MADAQRGRPLRSEPAFQQIGYLRQGLLQPGGDRCLGSPCVACALFSSQLGGPPLFELEAMVTPEGGLQRASPIGPLSA